MVKSLARLGYAWRRHGPIGFVMLAGYNVAYHARGRNRNGGIAARLDRFDAKYHTDTGGIREIGSLDVVDDVAARSARRYEPCNAEEVHTALTQLGIDYEDYSFIDFGSGKGRAVLVAAAFPFKEVVGVEFSHELHAIASQNIGRLPSEAIRAGTVRSIHGDAAGFELPRNHLVCYFYNPFGPPVISKVVQRLTAHRRDHGFPVLVIYNDPQYRRIFEETGKFAVVSATSQILTLTTLP